MFTTPLRRYKLVRYNITFNFSHTILHNIIYVFYTCNIPITFAHYCYCFMRFATDVNDIWQARLSAVVSTRRRKSSSKHRTYGLYIPKSSCFPYYIITFVTVNLTLYTVNYNHETCRKYPDNTCALYITSRII